MTVATRSGAATAREVQHAPFAGQDWLMLTGVALTWGASFLLIDISLEHFAPALVAFGRIASGAATLALLPAARQPLPRSEWRQIVVLAVTWMAIPFLLFAIAQQWIDSSLAGMINAATPLFVALVAATVVRQLPSRLQAVGLVIGFLGVVAISLPSVDTGSNGLGIALILLAALLYGFAFNVLGPLQRRNGGLPVIWRAQLVATVLLLPAAVVGGVHSSFGWSSLLAVAALGALGTALAFYWFTTLVGRVGSTRASVTIYFVPIIAIVLGAALNDERLHVAALLGTAMVLVGAYVTTKPKPGDAG